MIVQVWVGVSASIGTFLRKQNESFLFLVLIKSTDLQFTSLSCSSKGEVPISQVIIIPGIILMQHFRHILSLVIAQIELLFFVLFKKLLS